MELLIAIEDKHMSNIKKIFNSKGTTDGLFDYLKKVEKVSVEIIPDKKRYRIWLKDGQTFEIEAKGFHINGNYVEFYNEAREEEEALFNIDNIGGWVSLGALKSYDFEGDIFEND